MTNPLFIAAVAVGAVLLAGAFIKSRVVKPIRVTAADIPRILAAVSAATRTPTFAAFVFNTPGQPDSNDAVNIQFSLENGRPGFDWVLLAPRNIRDKDRFLEYPRRRGYSYTERKMNRVSYLRVEDGDLVQLWSNVVTELYSHPGEEPVELIAQGFEWS